MININCGVKTTKSECFGYICLQKEKLFEWLGKCVGCGPILREERVQGADPALDV